MNIFRFKVNSGEVEGVSEEIEIDWYKSKFKCRRMEVFLPFKYRRKATEQNVDYNCIIYDYSLQKAGKMYSYFLKINFWKKNLILLGLCEHWFQKSDNIMWIINISVAIAAIISTL